MNDQQLDQLQEEAIHAAALLSRGFGQDVTAAVGAVVTALAAAAAVGTPANRIAAFRCLGQTVVAIAEREAQYLTDAKERQAAYEASVDRSSGRRAIATAIARRKGAAAAKETA